jgi:hypothetical protein
MSNKICNECNNKHGGYLQQFNMSLCEDYRLLNKYTLLKKLFIKQKYLLVDDDFEFIPKLYKSSGWGDATYVTRHELILFLCKKYNLSNQEDYLQNILKIEDYIQTIKNSNTRIKLKNNKKEKLFNKLTECELDMYSHDPICHDYIGGKTKLNNVIKYLSQKKKNC